MKTDNYHEPNTCSNRAMLSIFNQEAQRNAVCPERCLSAFSNLMKSVFLSLIKMNLLSFHFFLLEACQRDKLSLLLLSCCLTFH